MEVDLCSVFVSKVKSEGSSSRDKTRREVRSKELEDVVCTRADASSR